MINFFNTLSEALQSENLLDKWDCFKTINYGETSRHYYEEDNKQFVIVIYRDDRGMYERPIHYQTN